MTTQKLVYLVQRYELPLDGQGIMVYPEYVFASEWSAQKYCKKKDPHGIGFEYTCPCGDCNMHYRSWDVLAMVMEED